MWWYTKVDKYHVWRIICYGIVPHNWEWVGRDTKSMGKLVISKINPGSLFWRVFLMIEPSVRADATVVCLLARHAGRLPLLVFALQYKHHCCLIQICVTVKYWCAILVCNTCATSCFCPSFTSPVTCSQLTSISAWKPLVTTPDNCYCVCNNATVHSLVYTCITG